MSQIPLKTEEIDRQIVALIERRAAEMDPSRDDWPDQLAGIERVVSAAESSSILDREARRAILRHVASACWRAVQPMSVAFLGPLDSYSHSAVLTYFGDSVACVAVATIAAVFDSVDRGQTAAGVVPIENSTDGRIVDTLGRLIDDRVQLVGEVLVPIHHYLLASVARDQITEVHSKPQAISQCRQWLARELPGVKLVEASSTAGAAELASKNPGVAAIASEQAGRRFGLRVIAPEIEDNRNNVTRFAILGRTTPKRTGNDKTTLLFQVAHQPGALADVMTIFKTAKLNLTWIESFPLPGSANEYFFVVEFRGHADDDDVRAAIDDLAGHTRSVRVLGSYPVGLMG